MREQKSIIDDIKRNIFLKKKIKAKNLNLNFSHLIKLSRILFNLELSEEMILTHFFYKYVDKNGKTQKVKYKLKEFDKVEKRIIVTRDGSDGFYTTQLEISNNKILYFETVLLDEPPFQIWGTVGKMHFRNLFKKRVKLFKKEIEKWIE